MAIFKYKALDKDGNSKDGVISAVSINVAINSLQQRGFIISDIKPEDQSGGLFEKEITFFERVSMKDLVMMSRQMATLFGAQVSALKIFRLIASENENPKLARTLTNVAEDIQGGSSISAAMSKSPDVFSGFYISMVRAGEESGRLDETFSFLADYLDRSYAVTSKAKNALIYPAFIITTFFVVMGLMLTLVIPKISQILLDAGQDIPIYTKIVIGLSNFLLNYGILLIIFLIIGAFMMYRYYKTETGKVAVDSLKLSVPYVGNLYSKLYLSRISDNLNTMLASGIPMVKTLELSKEVVDNGVFQSAIAQCIEDVKAGNSVSVSFSKHEVFPGILIQLIRVGEETGNLGEILGTLSKFYQREVSNAVDTLVGLIEPVMIVSLAVGVGILLASVLIPIYNISSTF